MKFFEKFSKNFRKFFQKFIKIKGVRCFLKFLPRSSRSRVMELDSSSSISIRRQYLFSPVFRHPRVQLLSKSKRVRIRQYTMPVLFSPVSPHPRVQLLSKSKRVRIRQYTMPVLFSPVSIFSPVGDQKTGERCQRVVDGKSNGWEGVVDKREW